MKKVAIFMIAAALAFTGCAKKSAVGSEDLLKFKQETESPTPSPTKKKKSTKKTVEKKETEPAKPAFEPKKYYINIANVNDQYQPQERVLYEGDILIFTNKDPSTKHSLTEGTNQTTKDPKFDSEILEPGKKWTWTVDVAPGTYYFHCEVVPYIQGGPLKVLERPA